MLPAIIGKMTRSRPETPVGRYSLVLFGGPFMLQITPVFQVPAEKLFCAWTAPVLIGKWLFKGDDSEIVRVELDLTVGGRFSSVEQTRHGPIDHIVSNMPID